MCFGGGRQQAAPATIIMPDTDRYDRGLDDQMRAIREQMDGQQKLLQDQLQSSLQRNQDLMERITTAKTDQANNAEAIDRAVAERFKTIRGPVQDLVPQQGAQSIVTGAQQKGASKESDVKRGGAKKSGKAGLRIARTKPKTKFGQGAGLNIT